MKKFLLAVLVVSSLVSCGKSNSVAPAAAPVAAAPVVNALTVTGQLETLLGSAIDNNQFGSGQADYYESWNQLVAKTPTITFNYGNVAATAANSNTSCGWKVGDVCLLTVYTSTSFDTVQTIATTRSVVYNSVDLQTKKNELKALLNSRQYVYQYGTKFAIDTATNRYVIDTAFPMQANPVSTYNKDGSSEQFLGAK